MLAFLVQEYHGEIVSRNQKEQERRRGVYQTQQHAGSQAFVETLPLLRSHILSRIGSHGRTHCVKRTAHEHGKLVSRRYRRHIGRSQAVYGGLEHYAAYCGYGVLKSHGKPHKEKSADMLRAEMPVFTVGSEYRIAFADSPQAAEARHELSYNRCQSRAENVHFKAENEHDIQHDIHNRGDNKPAYRGLAVPKGTEYSRGHVVQKVCGYTCENGENISIGTLKYIVGSVCEGKYFRAEYQRYRRNCSCKENAQPQGIGHISAELLEVPSAEHLGDRNGKSVADSHNEADNEKVYRACASHGGKSLVAEEASHNSGVGDVVELLK